jgi:hydrogenase maturation protein HypF
LIRVRGLVQGVGFRPTVWRLARHHGLGGWVANDGEGVIMSVRGSPAGIAGFVAELARAPPPLARIDAIERTPSEIPSDGSDFRIMPSRGAETRTGVVPDAATCPACRDEIFDRGSRRYRYPLTNCTHCGPRLSIIQAIPYDRSNTTMRAFRTCDACAAEYANPADRRFHAQPIACPACGPRVWLQPECAGDAIEAARMLLLSGCIVAIKTLGGFHLACDASDAGAVARLRHAKRRDAKPFALMGRDIEVVKRYAAVTPEESAALCSTAAPIVVLNALSPDALPGVAPGLATLGFMLPSTPAHHLLLRGIERPLVMTSGNLSDEPQCIDNDEALRRLHAVAEHFLLHDRPVARRVDDSIVRVMGGSTRVLRRARGYAPAALRLPTGFADAPPVLAMGGELKNTFCLLRDGDAVMSHHMGDLENAATYADYCRSIEQYSELFAHEPQAIAVDCHPDYLSTKRGMELGPRVFQVQHHHAHLAACLVENGVALDAEPTLGIILDGLGWGSNGTLWGGEFLLGDYRHFRRLACFKPVAMPGGAQAVREPWRNAVAHIIASIGWPHFTEFYGSTDLARYLAEKPVPAIASMIERGVNAPLASSCGRLFDAVAAAIGLCRDRVQYEGQAAMMLEALATDDADIAYPFDIVDADGLLQLDATSLWFALLEDLDTVPSAVIAARFHAGLANALVSMVEALQSHHPLSREAGEARPRALVPGGREGVYHQVALSGGVFQNRLLLDQASQRLEARGVRVLTHRSVPANDGGLALGQAVIAAACMIHGDEGE